MKGRHTLGTGGARADRRSGAFTAVAAFVLVLLTTACGADTDPFQVRLDDLESYAARWASTRPDRYIFGLARQCECLPNMTGPVVITVDGATVIGRYYEESGETVPAELEGFFPSVEGLFDIIRDALENRYSVTVTFDEQTGIPITLWVDPDPDGADDEFGYSATFPVALPDQGQ